jgi:citrate synthase
MEGKLTPAEAAKRMGVKPGTVRSWIAKKRLTAEKIGGRIWIDVAAVEALRVVVGQ